MPNNRLNRRTLTAAFGALALAPLMATPGQSHASDFPKGQVRLVVNFPAGGPLDILARQLATRLATLLSQPFIVENITGATGHIGAGTVARAQPDGLTVLLSIDAPFTSGPWLIRQIPYASDALRPVSLLGSTGLTLAVHPGTGIRTLAELVEKGKREAITFSTPGIGGPGHFAALLLSDVTGIKVNPIHYRGNAPAVMALLSGEVQAGILSTSGLLSQIKAEKIRPLAAASRQRSYLLPEIQTLAELGYPAFTLQTTFVAMVPAKTPDATMQALHEAFSKVMRDPELQKQLRGMDIVPSSLNATETAATLNQAREDYRRMVQAAGMQPE